MVGDNGQAEAMSEEVLLLADTQFHYLYGDPTFPRIEMIDRLTDDTQAAIRPVQLDYHARDLLAWHLRRAARKEKVIYLGDALDLSCAQEMRVFTSAMAQVNANDAPWFMAPGNHDGYFYGHRDFDRTEWDAACGKSRDPKNAGMNKAQFVEAYLGALLEQKNRAGAVFPDFATLGAAAASGKIRDLRCEHLGRPPEKGEMFPAEGCYEACGAAQSGLHSIAWRIDREKPWRSFVVQRLDLTLHGAAHRTTGIVLDTSVYDSRPWTATPLGLNAGVTGDLVEDEIAIVHRWARLAAAPKDVLLLFGHHPFDKLASEARRAVEEIVDNYRVPLFVSAHTHAGFWKSHATNGSPWIELNVGSTTDFPAEQRSLQLFTSQDRLFVKSVLSRVNEVGRMEREPEPIQCKGEWQAQPGDPEFDDYYLDYVGTSYSPEETQLHLWDAMLRSHLRLFSTVRTGANNEAPYPEGCANDQDVLEKIRKALSEKWPPDQKARLLIDLERFDRARTFEDKQCSTKFRLCQAVWASQFEGLRDRKLEPHDDTIVFPWR